MVLSVKGTCVALFLHAVRAAASSPMHMKYRDLAARGPSVTQNLNATTTPAPAALTVTSEVNITSYFTVISCASTVTDCPAGSKTVLVASGSTVAVSSTPTSGVALSTGGKAPDANTTSSSALGQSVPPVNATSPSDSNNTSPVGQSTPLNGTAPNANLTGSAATTPAGLVQLTTLTVTRSTTYTSISCAATITNCPAAGNSTALARLPSGAVSTVLITDVIDVTTTICPVTAASSISSALAAGRNVTVTAPSAATAVPAEVVTTVTVTMTAAGGAISKIPKTLTVAQATGSAASASAMTSVVTVTVTDTAGSVSAVAQTVTISAAAVTATASAAVVAQDTTTTVITTAITTVTITLGTGASATTLTTPVALPTVTAATAAAGGSGTGASVVSAITVTAGGSTVTQQLTLSPVTASAAATASSADALAGGAGAGAGAGNAASQALTYTVPAGFTWTPGQVITIPASMIGCPMATATAHLNIATTTVTSMLVSTVAGNGTCACTDTPRTPTATPSVIARGKTGREGGKSRFVLRV